MPNQEWCLNLIELIKPSMVLLTDSIEQSQFFFEEPLIKDDAIKQLKTEGAKESLQIILERIECSPIEDFNLDQAKQLVNDAANYANLKKGLIMKSLRAALMGCLQGPDLITTWGLLARISKDSERLINCL